MAPDVLAYVHGIYPRSETLVAATRDLERDRTTPEKVEEQFRREREDVLDLQREAGLDFLTDGLLRWADIFRPLVEASRGLDARVLVRWFDNNSFYRAPEIATSPRLGGDLPSWITDDGVPEPRVATLPSPFLFSRAAQSEGDRDALMVELAGGVLRPAVEQLVSAGAGVVHLQEPWLAFHGIGDASWDPFGEALTRVREGAGGVPVLLHTYFGDAAPYADRLTELPVDGVGIDFAETDLEALAGPWETGLLVGCLDGRRSVIEDAEQTASFVGTVAERLRPTRLFVSSGSDLELLPADVAREKVRLLGRVAKLLREAG
jgi:5-methyltetrahydropteroyltriglutamate--homocysteine methyltransferase